jgi:hypothetical protein
MIGTIDSLAKSARTMSFEIVTIHLGEPPVNIVVYSYIVCSVAPYFSGAFNHYFREIEERIMYPSRHEQGDLRNLSQVVLCALTSRTDQWI